MYDQRDIILIPFPYSDLTGAKQRPALILSNKKINKTEDRICCLITSNAPSDGLLLDSFEHGKLPFDSWAKPHRLFTVSDKVVRKKICKISILLHDKIVRAVIEQLKRD